MRGARRGAGLVAAVVLLSGCTSFVGTLTPAASPYIERDPSVNKSLLLRLIAGVRGL